MFEVENIVVLFLLAPPGVHYVFDTTIAADFSILESQREFVQRYQRRNQEEHALPMFASACPGEIWFIHPSLPSNWNPKELRKGWLPLGALHNLNFLFAFRAHSVCSQYHWSS